MKVLMVGNAPTVKGGITSVISQLLRYDWKSNGIEMSFIPSYVGGNNVKKILYFLWAYLRILKKIKIDKPNVVHIHMSYKGSFVRANALHQLCQRNGIPVIIHLHGSEFEKWYDAVDAKIQFRIRALLSQVSAFIVLGDKWNQVVKRIEPRTKTFVVQNTVSIPKETVQWKSPCRFLFMGVLIKRKGVADLLQAVNNLKGNGLIENYKFVIAGSGSEEESLKKMCIDLGLDGYVEFTGWIAEKKKEKLYQETQAMILPSYNEGLPIAILEAISYGMPVIASDVGDISSAVKNHENGVLIRPGDVDALTQAIIEVGQLEHYVQYSDASKKLARTVFSDELYYSQMIEIYQKCVSGNIKV